MITKDALRDLADQIYVEVGCARLKEFRYDPVAYADAIMTQADAEGRLSGLDRRDRERLRAELIRQGQADVEWIEGLKRLDYE